MYSKIIASFAGFALFFVWHISQQSFNVKSYPQVANNQGFVVLELFTSQGCSSCPSADRLLAKTFQEAQQAGKSVFVLSYHVDYWDRLGWKDPYSQAQYTQRQYEYGEFFHNSNVYTPQLVVNGKEEFVGSNAVKLAASLEKNLSSSPELSIAFEKVTWANDKIEVACLLDQLPKNVVLNVALVSKSAETFVPRGENEGRKLIGSNIVRVLQSHSLSSTKNIIIFAIPKDLVKDNARIVVFAQNPKSHQIVGASAYNF